MAKVDPLVAQWLQSESLWSVSDNALTRDQWGDTALTAERATGLAAAADAAAEGMRVLAFRGFPIVEEVAELPGSFIDTIGTVITIEHDELGYQNGCDVFVIAAEDDRASNQSRVTFLRRLA
mgnify:CR=1 FL=1